MGSEFLNDNHQEIAALLSSISDTPMEIKESGMQPKNSDSREKELMEIIQVKHRSVTQVSRVCHAIYIMHRKNTKQD